MGDRFDCEAFFAALNAIRLNRHMTWKSVADEAKINASTLTRMGQGSKPDVNGLAALLAWSNLKAEMFIPESRNDEVDSIGKITALLRADPHLSKDHARLIEDIVVRTYDRLKGS